jgi:ABC-type branched-subunit amino acid transport system ATPase component
MSDLALTVRDVHAGYGGEDVLHGVSLDVSRGTVVAVIGPNGSGKSTLLKAIYGLLPVRRGSVILFDNQRTARDLADLPPHRVTALGVNMVPQLGNVFPNLSVQENLEIGALPARRQFNQQLDKVFATLPQLGTMLRKRAATLSGGQRQMLGLARALMSDPSLLILDEPSAGLAPMVQDEVFAQIRTINSLGVSVLMVEQKARQCLAIADYGYVLEQGRNRLDGPAKSMLEDREVVRLYLGVRRL